MKSVVVCFALLLLVGFLEAEQKKKQVPPRFPSRLTNWLKNFECLFCVDFLNNLYLGAEQVVKQEELDLVKDFATQVCLHASAFDMGYTVDYAVCRGMVEEYTPDVYYIMFQSLLGAEHICEFIDVCPPSPGRAWNITFSDTPKPPVEPPQTLDPSAQKYRVLHLSDLHYEPDYSPGSNANCLEPTCCRAVNGPGEGDDAAGYWGDYRNCDPPKWTFESLLQNAAQEYNGTIDFILYSGDTPAHVDWETSPEVDEKLMNSTFEMIRQYFPDAPFFGTLGNHESSPINTFPSDKVYLGAENECSMQWLYDTAADVWSDSLDISAQKRLKDGGFYAQKVPGFDNLIVVSLNMNFGDSENWWLLVDSIDPYDMLQWLSGILQMAEDNGDKVMIVAHQSSANGGQIHNFQNVYYDLAYRYESTILGHFMGHSHKDEFYVYLDPYNISRAFGMSYVTGSVTTYSFLNVMYRVYEYDLKTHQLVDVYNHIFNLTEANIQGPDTPPNWYLEYTPKTAYGFNGTQGITFQDWADLTVRFETDDDLWNDYMYYNQKSARAYGDCTGSCKTAGICGIRTTTDMVDFCADMASPPTKKERKEWLAQQTKFC